MKISKVTPILVVEAIEPCLAFWTGPMGYTQTVVVPHEDRLGFVLLVKEGAGQVMMQTRASVAVDLALELPPACILYMDVPSLEGALAATTGATIIVPPRTTFYGAREAFVQDAAGNVVAFAEHQATAL